MPEKSRNDRDAGDDARSGDILSPVSGTSRPRLADVTMHTGGRLPHWRLEDAMYFVTFRLWGSLPKWLEEEHLAAMQTLRCDEAKGSGSAGLQERRREMRRLLRRVVQTLDQGHGACYMKDDRIAKIVGEAIRHFNRDRYRLFAWCVMPNHVHVVVRPLRGMELERIVQSWKGFSAKMCNRLLARRGAFWQREYFDHIIRDEDEFWRAVRYVVENPLKANLSDWKWVWAEAMCRQDADTTGDLEVAVTGE